MHLCWKAPSFVICYYITVLTIVPLATLIPALHLFPYDIAIATVEPDECEKLQGQRGRRWGGGKGKGGGGQVELTLLGMVMGMQESDRMMVRMGSTRSTVPTTNLLPPTELISIRSPTTKGRDMNCNTYQHMCDKTLVKK